MRSALLAGSALAITTLISVAPASAWKIGGFVGQVWEQNVKPPAQAAAKAAESTAKAATAPLTATVDAASGKKNLSEAATDIMQKPGTAISDIGKAGVSVSNSATSVTVTTAKELTNAVGGDGIAVGSAVAALEAPSSLLANAAGAGVIGVGQVIEHGDLSYAASAPLAAALSDAHARLQGIARPLPDDVKARLAVVHSAETLARARYVVGDVPLTLASLIDRVNTIGGADSFAVTVDNIIVFSRLPGTSPGDLHWWAHEVQHTVQYRTLGGIDAFANAYMKNGPALERDADAKGDALLALASSQ